MAKHARQSIILQLKRVNVVPKKLLAYTRCTKISTIRIITTEWSQNSCRMTQFRYTRCAIKRPHTTAALFHCCKTHTWWSKKHYNRPMFVRGTRKLGGWLFWTTCMLSDNRYKLDWCIGVARGGPGGLAPKGTGKNLHNLFNCAKGTKYIRESLMFSNCECECD